MFHVLARRLHLRLRSSSSTLFSKLRSATLTHDMHLRHLLLTLAFLTFSVVTTSNAMSSNEAAKHAEQPQQPMLALPAPSDEQIRELKVGGEGVMLDHLGPIVVSTYRVLQSCIEPLLKPVYLPRNRSTPTA